MGGPQRDALGTSSGLNSPPLAEDRGPGLAPVFNTIYYCPVAQLVNAPDSGSGYSKFESWRGSTEGVALATLSHFRVFKYSSSLPSN